MMDKLLRRTRNRLTLLYSLLMTLFLLGIVLVSYFSLQSVIFREQKQELLRVTQEIEHDLDEELAQFSRKISKSFYEGESKPKIRDKGKDEEKDKSDDDEDDNDDDDNDIRDIERDDFFRTKHSSFYFAVGPGNLLLLEKFSNPLIRNQVLVRLADNNPVQSKFDFLTIKQRVREDIHFIILTKPVLIEDGQTAYIHAGTDITSAHHFLELLKYILLGLSLLFLTVAAVAGNFMAGRAMIPIKKTFERQRQFVADASHELRTPLSVMQTSLEAIDDDEQNRISPFSTQVLDDLQDEVKRMTRLVNELLILARADSEELPLSKKDFDLHPVAEKQARVFRHLAEQKQISLTANIPVPLHVYADQERVTQLISILLDNAVKYTPEGGKVSLELSLMEIDRRTQNLIITVKDTGIGIPMEERERIFGRFYRMDKGRSREMGGVGLGLAIATKIVEAHKGTISVDSTPHKGSVFTVTIPFRPEDHSLKNIQEGVER